MTTREKAGSHTLQDLSMKIEYDEQQFGEDSQIVEINYTNAGQRAFGLSLQTDALPDGQKCAATVKAKQLACITSGKKSHRTKETFRRLGRDRYAVDLDSGVLTTFHRSKLRYLLKSLLEQRRWNEACGVLGVLLGIGYGRNRPEMLQGCKYDYWAALTLLRRVEGSHGSAIRCRRMFRLLNRQQPNARCRGQVQLESALYLMNQGDREAAYNELRPIADGPVHREDPIINLCHGLNTHYLWYEAVLQEVSKLGITESGGDIGSKDSDPIEGIGENEGLTTDVSMSSEGHKFHQENRESSFFSSDSQRFRSTNPEADALAGNGLEADASIWQASQRSIYEETDEQGFLQSGEQLSQRAMVSISQDLDPKLFPVRIVAQPGQNHYVVPMQDARTRDLHVAAVKHLKQALCSVPDMLPALLPLVQLYLAVHDISSAIEEINKCCEAMRRHITPWSLKATLLESLHEKDHIQLAAYYKNVLSINPVSLTCLKGLINLFALGKLGLEVLLESIFLHLDSTSGTAEIWRKLASCFLEVERNSRAQVNKDLESLPIHDCSAEESAGEAGPSIMQENSRECVQRLLSGRCKWWMGKHFSPQVMQKDQQSDGDRWFMAYKAACAAHIYGANVLYTRRAYKYYERRGVSILIEYLSSHCRRALKIFADKDNNKVG